MELEIRRFDVDDAPALHEAIIETLDHLRPWMPEISAPGECGISCEWRLER